MRTRRALPVVAAAVISALATCATCATARATPISREMRVAMSDGVTLHATLTGEAPLSARPAIVEFSPYGPNSGSTFDGPSYNYLLVQIRGTGDSDGRFDALGARTQADVADTLEWACHQPWSDGRLGLNGFSASAITIYNSLHEKLPCVRTAVLKSGTFELYRDLLWPGGISNLLPGAGVLGLIGAPAAEQGFARLQRNPPSGLDTIVGLTAAGLNAGFGHPTLDSWWRRRGFRGDRNHLPILMLDGFFDVESRGAFQAYQRLRRDGAHLVVIGAHDGSPSGTDGGTGETKAWFDRYLRGISNRVEDHPRVQLWLSDGSRESYLKGDFVRYDASDWPVPGTDWVSLWPTAGTPPSAGGSLQRSPPVIAAAQSYAAIPSMPSMTDLPNTAIVGSAGFNQLAYAFPLLTETNLAEPAALTYTTAPLSKDLVSAGPAALDLRLSSTAPESDIWAVIADVSPDGSSHPVATGRLRTSYPRIVRGASLTDARGDVVEPYGDYSHPTVAAPLHERLYHVELWPIGNRFRAGHRIRLIVVGASAASASSGAAINTLRLGRSSGSRLLLPVLPS